MLIRLLANDENDQERLGPGAVERVAPSRVSSRANAHGASRSTRGTSNARQPDKHALNHEFSPSPCSYGHHLFFARVQAEAGYCNFAPFRAFRGPAVPVLSFIRRPRARESKCGAR